MNQLQPLSGLMRRRPIFAGAPPEDPSAYRDLIRLSSPLVYYRLAELSGTVADDDRNHSNGTYLPNSGGVWTGGTQGVAGALTEGSEAARFNGSNGYISVALNLSAYNILTVEYWMYTAAFANDDRLAMEFTPNLNSNNGSFLIDPNSSAGSNILVAMHNAGLYNSAEFARPSTFEWHHYAFVMNKTASSASQVIPYVDGVAVSYSKSNTSTVTGNFANSTLYIGSRAGTSLFANWDMDEIAIYPTALDASTILSHYEAGVTV